VPAVGDGTGYSAVRHRGEELARGEQELGADLLGDGLHHVAKA
jgi:hypothetical protein